MFFSHAQAPISPVRNVEVREPLGMCQAPAGWGRICWGSAGLRAQDCKDLRRLLAISTTEKKA